MCLLIIIEICLALTMIKKILDLLKKNKQGVNFQRIAREPERQSREKSLLKKRLYALENKGAILIL